jgi:hypothetical protein
VETLIDLYAKALAKEPGGEDHVRYCITTVVRAAEYDAAQEKKGEPMAGTNEAFLKVPSGPLNMLTDGSDRKWKCSNGHEWKGYIGSVSVTWNDGRCKIVAFENKCPTCVYEILKAIFAGAGDVLEVR